METPVKTETVKSVLDQVFAETFALYFKTHSYHWNVRSADFHCAHTMLEGQYDALWDSLDEIAERLRVFNLSAPVSVAAVSALPYGTSKETMFADLLAGHESVIATLRSGIDSLEAAGDAAGADFLVGRLAEHEKTAWMLRASI